MMEVTTEEMERIQALICSDDDDHVRQGVELAVTFGCFEAAVVGLAMVGLLPIGAAILGERLRLFACDCAEQALSLSGSTDRDCLQAIRVARLYAVGEATKADLIAAEALADSAWLAASQRGANAVSWAVANDDPLEITSATIRAWSLAIDASGDWDGVSATADWARKRLCEMITDHVSS